MPLVGASAWTSWGMQTFPVILSLIDLIDVLSLGHWGDFGQPHLLCDALMDRVLGPLMRMSLDLLVILQIGKVKR